MRPASWWIEWPAGLVRVGVVFLVAATVVAVALRYPVVLRDAGRDASRNSDLSYSDREIAGGNGLVGDQNVAYAARGLIPEDASFRVSVDPAYPGESPLSVPYVHVYFRYFLFPRRLTEDGPWIICYACDPASYGARATTVWEGEDDISIVKVEQ